MTSQISTSSINELFPVAGQDNNSQGFRDNFAAVKSAIAVANSEITDLRLKAITKSSLSGSGAPFNNNLNGSLLENAEVNKFYGSVRQNSTLSVSTDIDIENGPLQTLNLGADISLRFINWPDSDLFGIMRLHIRNTSGASRTVILDSQGATNIKFVSSEFTAAGSLAQLTISNNNEAVIEAWTYDNGTNVYLKNLGIFV